MKNNKLVMIMLLIVLCIFSIGYKKSLGIYKETLNTKVYLSVLDPSQNVIVTFDSDGGSPISSMTIPVNTTVAAAGGFSNPTKANYNFLGWYKSDGVTLADPDEPIMANTVFTAHWAKIVCKKVTDVNNLNTETCSGNNGCLTSGAGYVKNDTITYGTIAGDGGLKAGDAFDCDVYYTSGTDNYDETDQYGKHIERFYFVREKENQNGEDTAVLIYYTSFDGTHGRVNSQHDTSIGSTHYDAASLWLPTSSTWANPGLISFGTTNNNQEKISRFLSVDDLETVCGPLTNGDAAPGSYLTDCFNKNNEPNWYVFENSRFQSSSLGRAGIWLETDGVKNYRIQTSSLAVSNYTVLTDGDNMARPVIEVPLSALEGYSISTRYEINFNTHDGTSVSDIYRVYDGDAIGTLPTTTREHFTFDGWYATYENGTYSNLVTASTIVHGNMTLHAKWLPKPTVVVTFNANGGTLEGEPTFAQTVDVGDTIDPLPVPIWTNHSFDGWYKDYENNVYSNELTINDVINNNMTVYAKWESANYVALVGDAYYEDLEDAIAATSSTKTRVTILKNITLTEAITIPSGKWVEFDLGSYSISGTTNLIVNNGKLDIINGTIEATQTTVANTIITNNSGATLNISGGTLNNASSNGTKEFLVVNNNGGTLNISGGTLSSRGQSATINMKANGTINVSGGVIKNTSPTKGQAIYMDHGTLNISGDSYIENTSGDDATVGSKNTNRAAVDNYGGTLNITGGTIVSKGWSAVIARSSGKTTTIGTNDETVDITTPVLRGVRYGLERTDGTVEVYDGLFESLDNVTAYTGTIDNKTSYSWTNGSVVVDGVTYHATYFLIPSLTVRFFPENGDNTISITVDNGDTIGTQMPSNPTKTDYYFDGWYDNDTLITSSTTVVRNIDAYARWVQSISNATISSTLSVEKDSYESISITGTDLESVTYTPSDSSIATVDSTGKVTGVGVGSTTITITGVRSGATRTVTVNVTATMRTVSFLDSDEHTVLFTRSVADNTALGAQMPSDPENQNYVFYKWYINGDSLFEFTDETIVTGNITVIANWKEKVSFATSSTIPSPFEIVVGNTGSISLSATSQNGVVEDYTFSSDNTNIATVNQSGVVTAVAVGNTDIVITGTMSNATKTVHVVVNPIMRTVTFKDGETVINTVLVENGTAIGNNMPANPTKTNYLFDTWYINGDPLYEFTDETVVSGDMEVVASWSPNIQLATLPASIAVVINTTKTIDVTGPSGMESYTFSSDNTNIATVDSSGAVTGVALGTTNIIITGTRSSTTRTVEVVVSSVPLRTVTFKDGESVIDTVTVEDGNSLDTLMIANPTKQNYIFNGWYINGDLLYEFTDETIVTGDIIVIANWKETIAIATVSTTPAPLRLMIGSTGQINVTATGGGSVEAYTFLSSNTNIVSVNSSGVVFGEDTGNVTITITGTVSGTTKTVQVEVVDTYRVVFDVDGDTYSTSDVMPNDPLGELPTPPTKSGYVFVGWYTTSSEPYTTRVDEETTIDGNKTYYARWAADTYQAEMNNELYTSVQEAVNSAPTTKTTIRLLKDVTYTTLINLYDSNTTKNIVLDLNNFTITNNNTYTLRTKAPVEIKNGAIIGKAGSGAVEAVGSAAILTLRNVNMTITGTRQAVYNDGGTINIYGGTFVGKPTFESKRGTVQNEKGTMNIYDANISSSATGSTAGAAVTCRGGALNIYGGTYTATGSNTGYGIYVTAGAVTIGEKDEEHDTTKITIQGKTNGVYSSQNIKFYDGIIEAISTSNAINDETKINDYETGATKINDTETISGVVYNRLYYTIAPSKYRINFNANSGNVTPAYKEFNLNEQITALDLPTPTRGIYEFDGWYTDSELTQPFASFTPSVADTVTYYAKWGNFESTLTPVVHPVNSEAMTEYFGNISSWVPDNSTNHENYMNHMNTTFTTYNCSECNGPNKCDAPLAGTYCDQPRGYDTGLTDDLNVYLYENNQKGDLVTYTTSSNGVIYNLIPGKTYYWESKTDNTKYGAITATGERRTLKVPAVRNLRDLGGMSVSYTDLVTEQTVTGTINYGKLYRGAQITAASGVTDLNKLGITREIDLRGDNDGNHTYKLSNYDTGTSSNYQDIVMTNYLVNPEITPYISAAHPDEYSAVKAVLRKTMEMVVNGDNIFFHCTIGTDRTGTLAYFLEGLLGVSEENRLRDYEMTYFFGLTNRTRYHDYLSGSSINPRFESMYKSYPTNQDIYDYYMYEPYVPSQGEMTDDELITAFRNVMINKNS